MYKYITLITHGDGFGAQFSHIILAISYCFVHNLNYIHYDLKQFDLIAEKGSNFNTSHNDKKIEINEFIKDILSNIDNVTFDNTNEHQCEHVHILMLYKEVVNEISRYFNKAFRQILQNAYNNNKPEYYKDNEMNIAIHIRRYDISDSAETTRWVIDEDYINVKTKLSKMYPNANFHIYCWKDKCEYMKLNDDVKCTFHISDDGKDMLDAFNAFVHADILVIGASSLSIGAAFFNKNIIITPSDIKRQWALWKVPKIWYKFFKIANEIKDINSRFSEDDHNKVLEMYHNRY